MISFYNTTFEKGKDLSGYFELAKEQEKKILLYLKNHPDTQFTSEDVAFLFSPVTPITSIRRAVCNLKKSGRIAVVDKAMGSYKRPIFVYQYVSRERQSVLIADEG
jgi:hypothetical protein